MVNARDEASQQAEERIQMSFASLQDSEGNYQ